MNRTVSIFDITFHNRTIPVRELDISESPVFMIPIPDDKPLVITTATSVKGEVFWTSIPEGRQKLAESIGKLIDVYFQKQNKHVLL